MNKEKPFLRDSRNIGQGTMNRIGLFCTIHNKNSTRKQRFYILGRYSYTNDKTHTLLKVFFIDLGGRTKNQK